MDNIIKTANKVSVKICAIVLLVMTMALTSCLKNSQYDVNFSNVGASVDLPLAAANNNSPIVFSYASSDSPKFPFYINLASPQTLKVPVTATFGLDTAYLTNYNANNGTNFVLLPASNYTVLNGWSRTIPAGQRLDSMYVQIKFAGLDLTQNYALPITITNASVPIEQWNHEIFAMVVKNIYDGNYNVTGYFFHPSAPRAIDMTKALATQGPNTCQAALGDLGSSNYFFNFDISGSNTLTNWVAEGNCPAAPASGFMTLDNPGGTDYSSAAPDAPGTAPWLSSTYNNTYDPGNKIFWMHYGYAGGGNGQNTFTRQVYEEWVAQ